MIFLMFQVTGYPSQLAIRWTIRLFIIPVVSKIKDCYKNEGIATSTLHSFSIFLCFYLNQCFNIFKCTFIIMYIYCYNITVNLKTSLKLDEESQ